MATEPRRLSGIARTLRLVEELLAGNALDADRAAAVLGVKRAAGARQLQAIARLPGVTVEKGSRPRRFRFDRTRLSGTASIPAAIGACFGASLGPLFAGTAYENGMAEASAHVHRLTSRAAEFRYLDRKFVFVTSGGESSLPDRGAELDDIVEAVLAQRRVHIKYRHFDGKVEKQNVFPLSLLVHDHQLYLMGRRRDGSLHPYRFARIEEIDATDERFTYPARTEYDPAQVFGSSMGIFIGDEFPPTHIEVRLHPRWRTYARTHRWHRSQTIREDASGVLVSLDVRLCPEVEAWVLGFGDDAEVIAPKAFREHLKARLKRMSACYETKKRKRSL